MSKIATSLLLFLLRLMGVSALFALVAVFMPMSWMAETHRWLGLGEMPTSPIIEYLARSLSAFYFFFGVLCLLAASDLARYRSIVHLIGATFLVAGTLFAWFGISTEMPWWWYVFEGPPQIAVGTTILFLAYYHQRKKSDRDKADG